MEESRETIEFYENRCAVCWKPFWQKRRGRLRRTCSAACRQKLYQLRRGKAHKPKAEKPERPKVKVKRAGTICPVCAGPMIQPERGRKRKTCSEACRKRLWRRQHPRCMVCGRHFKMARYQKQQKYCSKACQQQAQYILQRLRAQERAWREVEHIRLSIEPTPGTGYREEAIPWGIDPGPVVIRERKPQPNYEREMTSREAKIEAARQRALERKRQEEEAEKAAEEARKARRLAYDLLVDESKWRKW